MTITLPWQGTGSHRSIDRLHAEEAKTRQLTEDLARATSQIAELKAEYKATYEAWKFAEHKASDAEQVVVCQESVIRDLERQIREGKERLNVASLADAAGARTQEIDVRSLSERFATGPVRTLYRSPQAANPAHVPAWVMPDADTVALPVLADQLVNGTA